MKGGHGAPGNFSSTANAAADAAAQARRISDRITAGLYRRLLRSPTKRFVYAPGNIVPTWRNLRDVEIVAITRWLDNRLPIQPVDADPHVVRLRPPEPVRPPLGSEPRALLGGERLRGVGLARPVVSRSSRSVVYYLPRPGEDMASAEIVEPRLPQVVRMIGARVHQSMTSVSKGWSSHIRNGSRRLTMPRRYRPESKCPALCCLITPNDGGHGRRYRTYR